MIEYSDLLAWMTRDRRFHAWREILPKQIKAGLSAQRYGDLPGWMEALHALPELGPAKLDFTPKLSIRHRAITPQQKIELQAALARLIPWRKGPYFIDGLHIDTEWRSDWKWERVLPHLAPLQYRTVLDVGCGNGYHCWRMLGEGASRVIGIDPSPRFVVQWAMIRKLAGSQHPVHVLPVGIQAVPPNLQAFDTVFSMGILYHRKSPIDHLMELKTCLRPGGQLVLETLIIEGKRGEVLVPEGRYAKMPNVWFIPSAASLLSWMRKSGFKNPRMVDQNYTSLEEQRTTPWMRFESLADFLDPEDQRKTVEGHPAPLRAVFIAEAP